MKIGAVTKVAACLFCNRKHKATRRNAIMNLKGRNFLKLMDYTPEEILYLIDLAAEQEEAGNSA